MSEINLLPCPFCGGEAELLHTQTYSAHTLFWVECMECDCKTSDFEDVLGKEKAVAAWNTLKPMGRIVEKLEEEKGYAEDYSAPEDRRLVRHWNNCVDVCKEIVEAGGVDAGLL